MNRGSLLPLATAGLILVAAVSAPAAPNADAVLASAHRDKLLAALPADSVVVLHAAADANLEVDDVYRQGSDFFYLTGFPQPGAIAVLRPGAPAGQRFVLFVQPRNFAEEQWTGRRAGVEGAKSDYGADDAKPVAEFWDRWPDLQKGAGSLLLSDGGDAAFRDRLGAAWRIGDAEAMAARPVSDLGPIVHEMRLVKDAAEVARLRKASELSAEAHIAAMRATAPGRFEYALKSEMVKTCLAGGAARMGYPSIVGSGPNSILLHYADANRQMQAGEMIVNDTACEFAMYTADVTRSYPVSGKFSPEQRAVYEIVLAAQKAGIAATKTGATMAEVYGATVDVVVDGLLKLGLLTGDRAALISSRDFMKLYPHGSSHWIGLNVHDPSSYDRDPAMKERKDRYFAARRKLAPGMAITVEPGIYIPEDAAYDKKWWNLGARIEDTVLVTEAGSDCLSCKAPREIADVEKTIAPAGKR